jgi:hypothetical protein
MNPETEWRYPRANAYLLYEYRHNGDHYATDFPHFKRMRKFIFDSALKNTKSDSIVAHCSVVEHNEKSFAVPMRHMAHAYYFINPVKGIVSSKKDDLRKHQAYYDLRFKSNDDIHIDKFVQTEKWYHFPEKHNSVVYPNPDSRYIYVEYII